MVKSIDALSRGIQVLDALRRKSPTTLAELHRDTEISKATLLRILKTLQESNWVYRSLGDSQYHLSYSLQQINETKNREEPLLELSSRVIKELQHDLQWPSDIAIRDGLAMKIIESSRSQATFILNRKQIGFRPAMLFSAVGRTYLAFCPKEEREELIRGLKANGGKEGRLAHDSVWLSRILRETKENGFAEREANYWGVGSIDGRCIEAIAVPIFHEGRILASLTVVWPQGSITEEKRQNHVLPSLKRAAQEISESLPASNNS